ncbi:hypothetical protein DPMN_148516 [Dreissena polymorpha]|uniref:Uncharacterized protein n=1 Tax=Dreissena polymorpha TaxID=45954 RepID=A0A9D4J427_DREPO|nr:hypothetical protein DPMN_148516 [Dreissena polymorpha]
MGARRKSADDRTVIGQFEKNVWVERQIVNRATTGRCLDCYRRNIDVAPQESRKVLINRTSIWRALAGLLAGIGLRKVSVSRRLKNGIYIMRAVHKLSFAGCFMVMNRDQRVTKLRERHAIARHRLNVVVAAMVIIEEFEEPQRRKRRWWVKPSIPRRSLYGQYETL